jgi:hypothetical protein
MPRKPLLSLPIALLLVTAATARAGEFANILAPQNQALEQRSRAASAKALNGLQSLLAAFERSELRDIDGRRRELSAALVTLGDAERQIAETEIPQDLNRELASPPLQPADMQFLAFLFQSQLGFPPPKDLRELYRGFREATARLRQLVEREAGNSGPLLNPELITRLRYYLAIGELVSRVQVASR